MKNNLSALKKNVFTDALNSASASAALGHSIVTVVGRAEVCVEYHNGVLEYEPEIVTVASSGAAGGSGTIRITGKSLTIKSMNSESLTIAGVIETVTFGV
ncbi:MAG: hypothetical protein LBD85_04305 [Oscillospiraceae bacterium]|jgi:sporulation protein YqfC|nr:hypothetical protein [Oscillospiraceae bacterium]